MPNNPLDPLLDLYNVVTGKVFDDVEEAVTPPTDETTVTFKKKAKAKANGEAENAVNGSNGNDRSGTKHTFEFLFKPIGGTGKQTPPGVTGGSGVATSKKKGKAGGEQESTNEEESTGNDESEEGAT